ncbi:hypothetical protein [Methylobacterium haplocladii]|uniref:Uncharacterized protein n=2 Tax=Methylobacterium haplocladii TaxID=1176176 RepID=A0A512IJR5_9HYPH|nr:hypothetical protein [Methylobacterium haplocladii]GEO97963.1 hypothetical protein MHA02_03510 [Methylobacterium haplocladii]GJD86015.1 hypothetical protein HPGCJGGD_3912 [Methylobacterium haplocladii]GLS57864.1 hypothetical protein GCM10007887_05200 [Methylobacterium haplocladii]
MPLFDTKTLDNDFNGSALLASVLFATPQAKADAMARGRERLARSGSLSEAMTAHLPRANDTVSRAPAAPVA